MYLYCLYVTPYYNNYVMVINYDRYAEKSCNSSAQNNWCCDPSTRLNKFYNSSDYEKLGVHTTKL